jgi:hypothetical protein
MKTHWKDDEVEFLITNWSMLRPEEIARLLGRSTQAVKTKRSSILDGRINNRRAMMQGRRKTDNSKDSAAIPPDEYEELVRIRQCADFDAALRSEPRRVA